MYVKEFVISLKVTTFDVYNKIDFTWQDNNKEEELPNQSIIPEAIKKGALVYFGFQLNAIK